MDRYIIIETGYLGIKKQAIKEPVTKAWAEWLIEGLKSLNPLRKYDLKNLGPSEVD